MKLGECICTDKHPQRHGEILAPLQIEQEVDPREEDGPGSGLPGPGGRKVHQQRDHKDE